MIRSELSTAPSSVEKIEVPFCQARGAVFVLDELLELLLDAHHPVKAARIDGCEALLVPDSLADAIVHAKANLIERMRALELAFERAATTRQ